MIPKLSSWIVMLISSFSVNACSCSSGDIHVIVTVNLSYFVICHSLS